MSEVDAQALYIHRKHVGLRHIYNDAPQAVEAAQRYWERQLAVIAAELDARPADDFLLGPDLQACDVLLGHCLIWAASLEWLPVPSMPDATQTVVEYGRRLIHRPAFQKCVEMGCWSSTHLEKFL